ncbi:hypothetical protein EVG20_g2961 [Dentipellis fragilis]|uniref:Uncharacterized protein n=1 Tax=Dentipellis fragilis TaxID=205917 RepID=A0A4Y9Z7U3_9AGAM|nr:hypothetical protein EVG20_g2961 [Dentipellis fragilis]
MATAASDIHSTQWLHPTPDTRDDEQWWADRCPVPVPVDIADQQNHTTAVTAPGARDEERGANNYACRPSLNSHYSRQAHVSLPHKTAAALQQDRVASIRPSITERGE